MLNREVHFVLKISHAIDLPEDLANDVRVDYVLPDSPRVYRTDVTTGANINPTFNFQHEHTFSKITEELFKKLSEENITFKVWGRENMQSVVRFNSVMQIDLKQMVVEQPEKLQKLQAKREEAMD